MIRMCRSHTLSIACNGGFDLFPISFIPQSLSAGYCEKHKYEISKEVSLLALRSSLMESEIQRAEIARNRASNAALPIHRLPEEVLSEIFLLSVSPINNHLWSSSFLAVCHRWRKYALRFPRLWSVITIYHDTALDELAIWLSRSASAPLHIQFRYQKSTRSPETIMAHFTAAYGIISSHSPRIRSLHVTGIPSVTTLLPLEFPTDTFWGLCLKWGTTDQPASPLPVMGCDVSRNVQFLDLRGPEICRNAVHLCDLQFCSLMTLTLNQAVTVDSICKILPSCSSLEDLRWLYVDEGASWEWTMESFSLPKLSGLCISGSISVPFIESCDMPDLLSLSITKPLRPMEDVVRHLIRLTTVSEIELYSVSDAREDDFVSIFQNMPELERFSCDTWTPSNLRSLRILNEYARDSKDGAIELNCPRLNTLVIDGVRSNPQWDEKWEVLQETLKRYLKPLLRKRSAEYDEPLTVYLPSIKVLDNFGSMDGIRLEEDDPLDWE